MNPDTAKAVTRARVGEMPIDCGADLAAAQRLQRVADGAGAQLLHGDRREREHDRARAPGTSRRRRGPTAR